MYKRQALDIGETLTDQFTITATDNSTQTVTITINGAEDAPVVGGDVTGSVTEDGTLVDSGTLTISDTDTSDNPVNWIDVASTVGDNGFGSFVISGNTWTYTLDNTNADVQALDVGETLTDQFTFTATDNSTQTVTITINGAEDASVVGGDVTGSVTEDGTLADSGTLTISDTDTSDNPVSWIDVASTVGNNGFGSFVISGNTWTYTLDNTNADVQALDVGEMLTDQFTFTATDNSTQTVTVTIGGAEDVPKTAPVVLASVAEDSGVRVITQAELLANASDIEGDALTANGLSITVGNGTLVDNGNGTWSYTPAANDDTDISFAYTITDGSGNVATTATLDVTPVNDAPTATPIVLTPVAEDSGVQTITQTELLAGASDIEGDALTVTNVAIASGNGTLVDNGNGTWNFTPAANDDTSVNFNFTFTDGTNFVTETGSLDLTPVNDAPTTTPVALASVTEDSGVRVITQAELLAGASDIEGDSLLASGLTVTGNGTLVDNGDGTWSYTPAANDNTGVSFNYTISDGVEEIAGAATLDITPVNDAPTTAPSELASIAEDSGPTTITQAELLANANDIDGDSLVVNNVGIFSGNGVLVDNGDGTWSYTPAGNDDSDVTFDYTVSDGTASTTGNATLDITPVNDAPTISNIADQTIIEDGSTGPLAFFVDDVETPGSLSVSVTSSDADLISAGNLALINLGGGNWELEALGELNQSGTATITLAVDDGTTTVNETFEITITPVNDAPTITSVPDQTIDEDTAGAVTFEIEDVESSSGELVVTASSGNTSLISTDGITITNQGGSSRGVNVTPKADQAGVATIELVVFDGVDSTTTTFDLTVNSVNDTPTGPVVISGAPTIGEVLSASEEIGDVDGVGEIEYQWTRNGVAISGETAQTYELTNADVGSDIGVVASYVDGGGTFESITSESVNILAAPAPDTQNEDEDEDEPDEPDELEQEASQPLTETTGDVESESQLENLPSLSSSDGNEEEEIAEIQTARDISSDDSSEGLTVAKPTQPLEQVTNLEADLFTVIQTSDPSDLKDDVEEARVASSSVTVASITESALLWQQLDELRASAGNDVGLTHFTVGTASAATSSLIVGYVIWALRNGLLLSSLLATMPTWSLFDPLAIAAIADGDDDESEESIEDLVEKQKKVVDQQSKTDE